MTDMACTTPRRRLDRKPDGVRLGTKVDGTERGQARGGKPEPDPDVRGSRAAHAILQGQRLTRSGVR